MVWKVKDGAKLLHYLRWCLKDEDGVICIGVFEDGVRELLTSKKVRLQFAHEKIPWGVFLGVNVALRGCGRQTTFAS